jgi:membrane peptidoglycan carboxypeptidase
MRFNVRFTPELVEEDCRLARTPTINHASRAFIENKRYRSKPHGIRDVVNRNGDSVYQTDAVLILIGEVQRR